jgi:PAS domain S-box-containing protein
MRDVRNMDTESKLFAAPFLRQSYHPSESNSALKRAIGLFRVTSMLSNALTEEQVANIIIQEGFAVLGAFSGDIVMIGPDGRLYLVAYRKYKKEWAFIPEDKPLLTRFVIRTKKPYYIKDIQDIASPYEHARQFYADSKANSAIIIPLMAKKTVIGVMQFTYREKQRFSTEEKLFIQTLANQCALAFMRVKVQQELAASKGQLEGILENTADGIFLQDELRNVLYINDVCAGLFDISLHDMKKTISGQQLDRNVTLKTENGKTLTLSEISESVMKKKELHARLVVKVTYKKDGKDKWLLLKTTKINKKSHSQPRIITTIHDITSEKELDLRKDYFISIASHELKTPITSLKLFVELLRSHIEKSADKRSTLYIRKITEQTGRLQTLIMELLDVSRIQKGKMQYKEELLRVDELLKNTVQDLQLFSASHELKLISILPCTVRGDRFRLYQVITNLITNAVKYSPQQNKIIIRMKKRGKQVVVSVQDFGIGISKDQEEKIFDRFYQVMEENMKTSTGLGMGLFISREIVEKHNGKIWVESTKGKGTTFFFSLPIVK